MIYYVAIQKGDEAFEKAFNAFAKNLDSEVNQQAFEKDDTYEIRMKLADCHYRRADFRKAAELLKLAEKVFGKNARKRYIIRPINSLEHQKEYNRDMIMTALKSITKEQAIQVEIANTAERESRVSNILTKLLEKDTKEDVVGEAA